MGTVVAARLVCRDRRPRPTRPDRPLPALRPPAAVMIPGAAPVEELAAAAACRPGAAYDLLDDPDHAMVLEPGQVWACRTDPEEPPPADAAYDWRCSHCLIRLVARAEAQTGASFVQRDLDGSTEGVDPADEVAYMARNSLAWRIYNGKR